jgi:hypothetical protein
VAIVASLGGLVVGVGIALVASSSHSKSKTVVSTAVQTTTATQVTTATVTQTNTTTPPQSVGMDCPGRVHNGGAGIGNISVKGTTCNMAIAVLSAKGHLGWTCHNVVGGRNGFPGICEQGGATISYVAGTSSSH